MFVEALGHRLNALRKRQGGHFAVLFLDLDRFKVINDSLGHLVGDELLIEVSRRLESCLRDGDSLARLGGDEFAIFLNGRDEAQANAVAFRIQEAFSAAFLIGGREVFTSTSIGIAFSAFRYESPDDIMRDADTAMYHAKAKGRARFEVFDAHMHEQALDRIGLEKDLRQALRNNAFDVHYQPIVSLSSGVCVGFEALVRWTRNGKAVSRHLHSGGRGARPHGGARYVGASGGVPIVRGVAAAIPGKRLRLHHRQRVSASTRPAGFPRHRRRGARDATLTPGHLRLEITETAVLQLAASTAALLKEVAEPGVKIYLDDFGTGHSSLSHLHQLPVDALKIDRSFVASLLLPDRPAIVESILALAYTLGTGVVAEGVEDEVQALELERLGCRHAQGFLFSRPMSAKAAEALIVANQPLGPKRVQPAAAMRCRSVLLDRALQMAGSTISTQ